MILGVTGNKEVVGIDLSNGKQEAIINKTIDLLGMVERFGLRISRIIEDAKSQLLPEPEFKEEFNGFSVYFRKEFSDINDRQIKALKHIRENSSINNTKYQQLCSTSRITATRDLKELCDKAIIKLVESNGNFSYQKV